MSNVSIQSLIDSGIALVGMPYGHKGPRHRGWNLRENAVTNPAQYSSLRGMNMGLAHAYCTPSPTCAIDVDNYQAALSLLATHGIDPLAFVDGQSTFLMNILVKSYE
jgi:hypothetical protein